MRYLLAAWGGRDARLRSIRSSPEKIAIISLDLLQRWQSRERLRRPWISGVAGARSRPLACKTSRRWVLCRRFDPVFLCTPFRHGTQNPMEPPVGCGMKHRSIFRESHLRKLVPGVAPKRPPALCGIGIGVSNSGCPSFEDLRGHVRRHRDDQGHPPPAVRLDNRDEEGQSLDTGYGVGFSLPDAVFFRG
jgi:hypothetical protein